jgi:RHS repeat-associated protein
MPAAAPVPGHESDGYRYDNAGTPVAIGDRRYEYNAANRPVRVFEGGRLKAEYAYNARGERVKKTVYGAQKRTTLYFLYEDGQLLAEAGDQGRIIAQYVYLGYRPIIKFEGRRIYHIHADHIGLPRAVTDASGNLVWSADYAPFGRAYVKQAKLTLNLRYPGQYEDQETGTYYNWQRDYNPDTGRYLTPDPLGMPDGPNRYAYVQNKPHVFADPWGLAMITYYAITTGANGQQLGMNQGFTLARWAFRIYDIGTGEGAGRELLFDANGNFLRSASNPLPLTVDGANRFMYYDAPNMSGPGNPENAFRTHYGNNLFSPTNFTVQLDDQTAWTIIDRLRNPPQPTPGSCPMSLGYMLPSIPFFAGEEDIHPATANFPTNRQRILNCSRQTSMPVAYTNDEERRRIEKFEAAAELQESPRTSAIYRDCRPNGCRSGTDITVNGRSYYASYGRTQFVAETFLRTLVNDVINNPNVPQVRLEQLGLTQNVILPSGQRGTMADLMSIARDRATAAGRAYRDYRRQFGTGLTVQQATTVWNSLTPQQRQAFINTTGLGQTEFIDMLGYQPNGRARTENEGLNAFATEAAFRVTYQPALPPNQPGPPSPPVALGAWFVELFNSQDRYNYVSRIFLQRNLSTVLASTNLQGSFANNYPPNSDEFDTRQREIELDLARRVAILHNSGNTAWATAVNPSPPQYVQDYVREFLQVSGRGDWRSLRCSEELAGLGGLEMRALGL